MGKLLHEIIPHLEAFANGSFSVLFEAIGTIVGRAQ